MNLFAYRSSSDAMRRLLLKTQRIVKITAILLLAGCLTAGAKGFSQNVTLSERNASLVKVLNKIRKQTGYSLLFTETQMNAANKVTLNLKEAPLEKVLEMCFANQPFTYTIIERTIVVKPAPPVQAAKDLPPAIDISGRVTDESGRPLSGASVRIKGTNLGTSTNANGEFALQVPDQQAILIISFVDFETLEVVVGSQRSIKVTMKQLNLEMNQVVVVGYGTQRKKDLTGAVSTVSSRELENRSNSQFGYSIAGKAPGVQVIRSSGQPQAGFSIRVRGTSSITSGSDPLYMVDGVPTYNVNEINPADIESISILKDASSAAIFGSSGANGVVLITTKRGKNQRLKIGFNTSLTLSRPWKKMNVLNSAQFKEMVTDMGLTTDWSQYTADTDWQKEIFRNAFSQNYQLSATGGTKKTSYYVSGSLVNQNGMVLNNNLKRATVKVNVDHQLASFLKLGTSLAYDNWKDRDVYENNRNGVITRLITTVPIIGIRDASNPAQYARSPFINDLENPVSTVYQPEHLFKNNRYHGNVYAEVEILNGLKLKSLFGFEQTDGVFNSFQDSVQTRYGKSMGGLANQNDYSYKYWISENTANYTKKIDEHNLSLLGGFIVSRETTDNLYRSSRDFSGAKGQSVEDGKVKGIPTPEFVQKSHASFIGRLNYSFKNKYFLTSNFRADGSGQFSSKHKWGYFPSFSAGWRISEEDFFKGVSGINELKLRAGWGLVGNDRARGYAWFGLVDTMSRYLLAGTTQTAFIPRTLENSDLKWEKTSQIDIGIDLSVLNNRLTFVADYYYKKTEDLLLEVPQPTSTGYSTALQNAGSLLNKGFEFQVTSKNIVRAKFRWNTDFNISFNRNKVINIVGNTIPAGAINPAGDIFNTAIVREGQPLGSFYGRISQGVDPATGNMKFLKNNKGTADSIGIIGNANPRYIYGLTNNFSYGNFVLDIFFQGVQGNDVFNGTRILTESMALAMNQSADVTRRWRKTGDITDIPRVSPNDWTNSNPSTRYIENGSYLRLKAVTIGYNLPAAVLTKLKMSRCLIYFTGENLLTFTRYSGFDPEVSAFSGKGMSAKDQNTAPGVDFGTYPQSRDFVLGVNIAF